MRISDWSSDVCSSDLPADGGPRLLRELRRRPFWALFLVFFLTAIAVFSVSLQSVAYLVEQGFSPLQAAGAFGFTRVLSIAGMLATGPAADRFGNRITATVSYLCTVLGVAALFLLGRPCCQGSVCQDV